MLLKCCQKLQAFKSIFESMRANHDDVFYEVQSKKCVTEYCKNIYKTVNNGVLITLVHHEQGGSPNYGNFKI